MLFTWSCEFFLEEFPAVQISHYRLSAIYLWTLIKFPSRTVVYCSLVLPNTHRFLVSITSIWKSRIPPWVIIKGQIWLMLETFPSESIIFISNMIVSKVRHLLWFLRFDSDGQPQNYDQ